MSARDPFPPKYTGKRTAAEAVLRLQMASEVKGVYRVWWLVNDEIGRVHEYTGLFGAASDQEGWLYGESYAKASGANAYEVCRVLAPFAAVPPQTRFCEALTHSWTNEDTQRRDYGEQNVAVCENCGLYYYG